MHKPMYECYFSRCNNEVKVIMNNNDRIYVLVFVSEKDALFFIDGINRSIFDFVLNGQEKREYNKTMFSDANSGELKFNFDNENTVEQYTVSCFLKNHTYDYVVEFATKFIKILCGPV